MIIVMPVTTIETTRNRDSIVQDTYPGPRHEGEYNRLQEQHDMLKEIMNGNLILAPVNLKDPNLTVLDSATADGYWLKDLAGYVPHTARLFGADIAPQNFLPNSELPSNVSLFAHNMFHPWDGLRETFDFVHQRFVLPVCSDNTSIDVIKNLMDCVKPGGWIMLHDSDFDTIDEGPGHEAMELFRSVLRRSWKMMGYNLSPGPKIEGWLRDVGFERVQEEVLTIRVGASAENPELGAKPIRVLLAALEGIRINMSREYIIPFFKESA